MYVLEAPQIRRTASAMRSALIGRPTVRVDTSSAHGPTPQPGRVIERVDCRGRELDVVWDDGLVLHTALRRSGTWHLYRMGERWRRPQRQVGVMLENDDWVAVCFNAADVETFRAGAERRHPASGPVGPDVTDPSADLSAVVMTLAGRVAPHTRVRDALLDPHVMRGVGNVYAAEALWENRVSPWARVGEMARSDLVMLVNSTARLVREHLAAAAPRSLGYAPIGLSVYARNGQECHRCAEVIEVRRVRADGRLLYWCPGCQTRFDHRLLDDTPPAGARPAEYLIDVPRPSGGLSI